MSSSDQVDLPPYDNTNQKDALNPPVTTIMLLSDSTQHAAPISLPLYSPTPRTLPPGPSQPETPPVQSRLPPQVEKYFGRRPGQPRPTFSSPYQERRSTLPTIPHNIQQQAQIPRHQRTYSGTTAPPTPSLMSDGGTVGIGLEPYTCETCSQICNNQGDLKRHLLKHFRAFHCSLPECPFKRGFRTSNDLTRHQRAKHPAVFGNVGDYVCAALDCTSKGRAVKRKDNFVDHVIKKHGRENLEDLLQS